MILAHGLFHTMKYKRGKGGLMALMFDTEKTYDRMEWDFLGYNDEKFWPH